MIYKNYGTTGKKVSALGFGGMRFADIDAVDKNVEMMVEAARGGINYFDTAPAYFGIKSEEVYGRGLKAIRDEGYEHYVATKTFKSKPDEIRQEIEGQLERLQVDVIDFYHVWCITNLENWQQRKKDGVLDEFIKLKEEGLIKHICVSSHLIGDEIKQLLMEDIFEGVLFGYSAYNFHTRQAAFDAVKARNLGAVVMNPLGGGLIPDNPELFKFLKNDDSESIVQAALRFLFAHDGISVALAGFSNLDQIRDALAAANDFPVLSKERIEEIKASASASFEGICTGCQYCDNCPEGIQIPKYMDAYNQKILGGNETSINNRLKWHWDMDKEAAGTCVECGQCETDCTQHLPIISRLKEISELEPADK